MGMTGLAGMGSGMGNDIGAMVNQIMEMLGMGEECCMVKHITDDEVPEYNGKYYHVGKIPMGMQLPANCNSRCLYEKEGMPGQFCMAPSMTSITKCGSGMGGYGSGYGTDGYGSDGYGSD